MKIHRRLILLFSCLVAVFAAATWVLQAAHRREAESIRASIEQQRGGLLDRLLVLTGQSLRSFANDYSLWDEMLAFVQTGDRIWAKINIDASLVNFDVQAAWVLRPDGSLVYQTGELDAATFGGLPFSQPVFLEQLRRTPSLHFYLESPAGLLEVHTAPIQPSDDIARTSPARGWLVAVRLWSEAHVRILAETIQSAVTFAPPPEQPGKQSLIHIRRDLADWTGRRVRTLHVTYQSRAVTRLLVGNEHETYVLVFFGIAMLTVTGLSLSRWVLAPLRQLGQSLESGRTEPLQTLHGKEDEFGHLARLVVQSFSQRAVLKHEMRERSRMAEELLMAGNRLRESIELRNRLARDLHDGVIQSIYAAGLGLEGVRSVLRADPAGADQRLAVCQGALNDTIRDVRAFINSLESQSPSPQPFRQTLATLISNMQSIHTGTITHTVGESVATRLSPAQETQLLQIVRESISNALRHAAAASIQVSLQATTTDSAVLTVADDGRGFDPAIPAGRGHGLANLGIRTREMGGTLQIDSAPGKGTRIILCFNPTYPP